MLLERQRLFGEHKRRNKSSRKDIYDERGFKEIHRPHYVTPKEFIEVGQDCANLSAEARARNLEGVIKPNHVRAVGKKSLMNEISSQPTSGIMKVVNDNANGVAQREQGKSSAYLSKNTRKASAEWRHFEKGLKGKRVMPLPDVVMKLKKL